VIPEAEQKCVDRQVRETYTRLTDLSLPAHDKHLVSLSLSRLLKKDKVYKEVWLNNAGPVLSGRQRYVWSKRHSCEGNATEIKTMFVTQEPPPTTLVMDMFALA
jgi:hypothetical protein